MKKIKSIFDTPFIDIANSSEKEIKEWYEKYKEFASKTVESGYEKVYIIKQDRINRAFGKMMETIETMGLPERQENALKRNIKNIMFNITSDSYYLNEDAFYCLYTANLGIQLSNPELDYE